MAAIVRGGRKFLKYFFLLWNRLFYEAKILANDHSWQSFQSVIVKLGYLKLNLQNVLEFILVCSLFNNRSITQARVKFDVTSFFLDGFTEYIFPPKELPVNSSMKLSCNICIHEVLESSRAFRHIGRKLGGQYRIGSFLEYDGFNFIFLSSTNFVWL